MVVAGTLVKALAWVHARHHVCTVVRLYVQMLAILDAQVIVGKDVMKHV